ncbi:MAG: M28 family peptidase [Myxococcota bacterium]
MALLVLAVFLALAAGVAFHLTQPFVGAIGGEAPAADPARLRAVVEKLSGELSPRDLQHHENLERVAEFLRAKLAAAGGKVREQTFTREGKTFRNVFADFGPATASRLVVGAHYDARGPLPGADDNASGVAGLLELAQLLGASPPSMHVELAAYVLEEYGLDGSRLHAQTLRHAGSEVRAMFSLEMIGFFTDTPDSQKLPATVLRPLYPSHGGFIAVVGDFGSPMLVRAVKGAMRGAAPGLDVQSINAPRFIPGVDFSDHRSFWNLGYPALMLTDTAFYRNPHYHQASDTPATLDYERMAKVVRGVYGAIFELAK